MKFTAEQLTIIENARPIWEGYLKTQTINTGQREIAELRQVYDETFGMSGQYPEWSPGCIACVTNCMARIFEAAPEQKTKATKLEAASIATDEQPEPTAKAKKPSKKK